GDAQRRQVLLRHSTTLGTIKRSFAFRGALLSACSAVNQSRGSSSPKNMTIWKRVDSRFHMAHVRLTKFFNVIQHIAQLLLKSISFLFSQIDPRQSGDVRNIEIRGPSHGCRSGMQIADQPDDCDGKRDHKKEKNDLAVSSLFAHRTRTPGTSAFAVVLRRHRDAERFMG